MAAEDGTTGATEMWVPTLPDGYIDGLVDTGRWREVGVTHWHLVRTEAPLVKGGRPNEERFDAEAIRTAVGMAKETTADPREALRWVYRQHLEGLRNGASPAKYAKQAGWGTEADLLLNVDVSWEFMTERVSARMLVPIGRGVEVRPNLSIDVYAYPMTADHCRRH